MRVRMLGPLEVEADGRVAGIAGTRRRALLIRLAMDAGRVVTAESLAQALWAQEVPGDPGHALQALVSRLRRALPGPPVLRSAPGGYLLDLPPDAVDAIRFGRLAADGRRALRAGDAPAAARRLREALGLWRGEPLADVAQVPFAGPAITRLAEERLAATEDRIAADLQASADPGGLVAELEELAAAHPLRERPRLLLLRALHAGGRQAEALAAYESFRGLLATELGADPGPELQQAHLAVLRGEPPARPVARLRPGGNLRAPLSSFVGREAELTRLGGQLGRDRLITLTGPGGVGKTRLATTVAADADVPGGAWLVQLAPVADAGLVARAWIAALGLRDEDRPAAAAAAQDPADRLAEALSGAETLVVLDNCEHLIGAVAPLVEDLLGRCPRLRVLATSREPLGVSGEVLFPVAPLGMPEPGTAAAEAMRYAAVRLFAERAVAAAAGFAVTDANAAAVADICRRLDGLPLAIELAAARLRALPLEHLAARLGDRFAVLAGGSRTAPARHRTLRAVVSWSWELLSDDERALAERLAVFGADITPDAAAAVCPAAAASARPAIDLLAALVDKSLLQLVPGPEPRYRMLETIREYGLARLAEAGELARARGAHAAHFLAVAETAEPHLRSSGQLPWLQMLAAEHDNLLTALQNAGEAGDADTAVRLAAALGPFWTINGRHDEAATLLLMALDVPGDGPAQARAAATAMWAVNATLSAAPGRAGRAVALSGALAARDGEHPAGQRPAAGHPVAFLAAAALALAAGNAGGLAEIGRQPAHPEPWTRGMLRLIRAFVTANHGDMDGMRHDLAAAAEAFLISGERWGRATALTYLAYVMTTLGQFDEAVAALEESVRLLRELGSADGAVMQRVWLAEAFWKKGDTTRARAELDEIAAPGAARQPGRYAFFARTSLGDIARFEGDLDEAARQYEAAARDLTGVSADSVWLGGFEALLRAAMAHLAVARGDLAAAGRLLGDALALAAPADDMPMVAIMAVAAARLRLALGDGAEAARLLGAGHALRGGPDPFHPDVASLAADLRGKLGEPGYQSAYDQGRRLDRAAALALIQAQAAT